MGHLAGIGVAFVADVGCRRRKLGGRVRPLMEVDSDIIRAGGYKEEVDGKE